jgi:hypothetical protein
MRSILFILILIAITNTTQLYLALKFCFLFPFISIMRSIDIDTVKDNYLNHAKHKFINL